VISAKESLSKSFILVHSEAVLNVATDIACLVSCRRRNFFEKTEESKHWKTV